MTIISDKPQQEITAKDYNFTFFEIVINSYKMSMGWQIANTFNILFNTGMFILNLYNTHNVMVIVSLVGIIFGIMGFIGQLVKSYDFIKKQKENQLDEYAQTIYADNSYIDKFDYTSEKIY